MEQEKLYGINYVFGSSLGETEGYRYINDYLGEVYEEVDEQNSKREVIGKVYFKLIKLGLALNDGYDLYYIFDMEEYLFRIGNQIISFESGDLGEGIQEYYNYEITQHDICILERLELLPAYRSKGLGKKIIKDIYNNFSNACGLFVVHVFPLQFEARLEEVRESEWEKKMAKNSLDADFEKSIYQLKSFYQKVGFDYIEGYGNLMFLNPSIKNEKLDNIQFE